MNKPNRGFTLVELMIVVAVIAILAAIAVPNYRDYVMRSHRASVKATMANVLSMQEQFFLDRKRYATKLSDLGFPADTLYIDPEGNAAAAAETDSTYKLTLKNYTAATIGNCSMSGSATNLSYTVVAEPYGGQAEDAGCATLCQANNGQRGNSGSSTTCWSK